MNLQKFKENTKLKKNIISFAMVSLFLLAGIYLYTSFAYYEEKKEFNVINGTVQDPGDLYFAFYVDEVISKNMPAQGDGYILDNTKSSCTNGATPELDTENWSIIVKNMTIARTKCTLHFKKEPTALSYVQDLAKNADISSTDVYTVPNLSNDTCTYTFAYDGTTDNNLRYVGSNPCNYVTFNGESAGWRIIGVLNTPEGQRVKLIRASSIGTYAWDDKPVEDENYGYLVTQTKSNWPDSTLKEMLNSGAYYNRTTGTYYNGMIWSNKSESVTLDFTSNGLTGVAKKQIDTVTWGLGSCSSYNIAATEWYACERGTKVYEGYATTWQGQVGLIHPSDYAYATVGSSSSSRSQCLSESLFTWNESDQDCVTNDWLQHPHRWTLTTNGAEGAAFRIPMEEFGPYSSDYPYNIEPVIYLVSSVKITSGEGSQSNPYILES